jgi:hypothetical protein
MAQMENQFCSFPAEMEWPRGHPQGLVIWDWAVIQEPAVSAGGFRLADLLRLIGGNGY